MIYRATRVALMPTYANVIDKLAAAEMDASQKVTGVTDVTSISGIRVYYNSITRPWTMSDLFYDE